MDIKIIVAGISVAGVLLSACVQFFLGKSAEKRQKMIEMKSEAYLEYMNVFGSLFAVGNQEKNVNSKLLEEHIRAKLRVSLVASDSVLRYLEELYYLEQSKGSRSQEALTAYSELICAMRVDLSKDNKSDVSLVDNFLQGKR